MKASRVALHALTLSALVGLVGVSYAARSADDSHDLTARFEKGQKLELSQGFELSLALDDAEIKMGDQPFPMTPTVNINIEGEDLVKEEVLAAADGAITKLKRTYDTSQVHVTGQAGMGENTEDIDQEEEGPLNGRILLIEKDDEGKLSIEDQTNEGKEENEQVEDLEESALAVVDLENHFEFLLPTHPVTVGESWDIGKPFMAKAAKMIGAAAATQEDEEAGEKIKMVFDEVLQNLQSKATGKLVSVDGDTANIKYAIEVELNYDQIGELITKIAGDQENLPQDMDGEIKLKISMKGNGKFNLKNHQLADLALEGDFSLSIDMAMTMPQMDMEMSMSGVLSGTLSMTGGVSVVE